MKKLVGHAQSFDLSGLEDVPPIDLPALKPFFLGALSFNGRRVKTDGEALSFKTPDSWLNHPAIRREYSGMVFDRKAKLVNGIDLMGIGHPLVTRALRQAQNFVGAVAIAKGLDKPVVVFHISDRVTDGGAHVKEVVVGMTAHDETFEFHKDWQLLNILNGISTTDCTGKIPDIAMAVSLLKQAKLAVNKYLPGLDLPFSVPDIHEMILLWPDKLAV